MHRRLTASLIRLLWQARANANAHLPRRPDQQLTPRPAHPRILGANELVLVPHVPEGITLLDQRDPIRWGSKRIYISVSGSGAVTGARVNGKPVKCENGRIVLSYETLPERAQVVIARGAGAGTADYPAGVDATLPYLQAHARLAANALDAAEARKALVARKEITPLPGNREEAAQKLYDRCAEKLSQGPGQ